VRTVVTILRLVTHVDRASALLSHVASATDRMVARRLPLPLGALLGDLATRSSEVFRAGLDAWRTRDPRALREVVAADESVDALQVELLQQARDLSLSNDELVGLGLLARYYERIADHGVAFARDVAFVVTGERPVSRA
jgi:phosphate transport system protein